MSSAHASQFFISLLDSNNKEQRLDEKGLALGLHSPHLPPVSCNVAVITGGGFLPYRGCAGQPP